MKIAIVTGASSGIGKTFCSMLPTHFSFDEVWVIARRKENLEKLKSELPYKIRIIPLDLSINQSFDTLRELLESEKPEVELLINCSGFGRFEKSTETPIDINLNMIDLNCKAVVSCCSHVLPFMPKGGRIINIASVAALQPIPYINVYGATKAFVLSYSRALNRELKDRKISVTAVCPFWTKTEFFNRAVEKNKEPVVKKYVAMYEPEQIVKRAYRDAIKRKDVSFFGFKARGQALLVKLLPHSMVMNVWLNQQKLK
jgi:short-subunit dehydrogenase